MEGLASMEGLALMEGLTLTEGLMFLVFHSPLSLSAKGSNNFHYDM